MTMMIKCMCCYASVTFNLICFHFIDFSRVIERLFSTKYMDFNYVDTDLRQDW